MKQNQTTLSPFLVIQKTIITRNGEKMGLKGTLSGKTVTVVAAVASRSFILSSPLIRPPRASANPFSI